MATLHINNEGAEDKWYSRFLGGQQLAAYCIFSIKCPPAFISNLAWWTWRFLKKQFIWACHFLRKGHYSFFFAAM